MWFGDCELMRIGRGRYFGWWDGIGSVGIQTMHPTIIVETHLNTELTLKKHQKAPANFERKKSKKTVIFNQQDYRWQLLKNLENCPSPKNCQENRHYKILLTSHLNNEIIRLAYNFNMKIFQSNEIIEAFQFKFNPGILKCTNFMYNIWSKKVY